MAMTVSVSLSPTTVTCNQTSVATITVSNSGGAAVSVTSISLDAFLTGGSASIPPGFSAGLVPLGPGVTVSVPASGSLTFTAQVAFFAPSGSLSLSSGTVVASTTYSVVANCTSNDGSNFVSSAATITVNPIPVSSYPTSQFP